MCAFREAEEHAGVVAGGGIVAATDKGGVLRVLAATPLPIPHASASDGVVR